MGQAKVDHSVALTFVAVCCIGILTLAGRRRRAGGAVRLPRPSIQEEVRRESIYRRESIADTATGGYAATLDQLLGSVDESDVDGYGRGERSRTPSSVETDPKPGPSARIP